MKWIILIVIIILAVKYFRKKKSTEDEEQQEKEVMPADQMHTLLSEHVPFYQRLPEDRKPLFRKRVQHFLDTTKVTPVGNAEVTGLDRLYVASSAIIPIFSFDDWAYNNLDEVLIYPGTFTKDFDIADEERNVLGMVGDGAMHRMMILSLPSLRAGFEQKSAGNTAIHEFVHLLDKADGATDGVPEYMIPKDLVAPWMRQMHKTIQQIRNDTSDLNPYAGTNEAEFFAVLSEYFFQKPGFLKEHHPQLYHILEETYRRREQEGV
jgi:Mlc titration factor MtfA (ptsG expression regulator)